MKILAAVLFAVFAVAVILVQAIGEAMRFVHAVATGRPA